MSNEIELSTLDYADMKRMCGVQWAPVMEEVTKELGFESMTAHALRSRYDNGNNNPQGSVIEDHWIAPAEKAKSMVKKLSCA